MRISKAPHLLRKIAAQGAYKSNLKTNMTHTKKEKNLDKVRVDIHWCHRTYNGRVC